MEYVYSMILSGTSVEWTTDSNKRYFEGNRIDEFLSRSIYVEV